MRTGNTRKIAEFCVISSGGTSSRDRLSEYFGGSIPWVKSGELREKSISRTEETLTEIGLQNSSAKYLPKYTVLIAMYGATVGRTAILEIEATTNQAVAGIVPDKEVADYKYLFHFLRFYAPRLVAAGVGGAQPNISQGILKNVDVPLPPLPIQKQIAAILEKADAAREKRQQANQLTEQFLQSTFLEMFGDPVTNPKGWDSRSLGEIAAPERFSIVDGPFGSHLKASEYTESGVRVIRVNNIFPNEFNFDDVRYISSDKYANIKRSTVRPNDVIMAKVGNTIGKTCVFPTSIEFAVLTANVCKITLDKVKAIPVFVSRQMNFEGIELQIRKLSGDTAKPMINLPRLRQLRLVVPPLSEQQKFAALVEKVEGLPASGNSPRQAGLRGKQRESENQLEKLFGSLMQRAFRGELVA
jgi:type I restriction enzyme S subunit